MTILNTSGLITRGLGELHKLLTRGLGGGTKINRGLPPKIKIEKEYLIDIFVSVQKENILEKNILAFVYLVYTKSIQIKSNVSKETIKSFDLETKTNHKKLFDILDAI